MLTAKLPIGCNHSKICLKPIYMLSPTYLKSDAHLKMEKYLKKSENIIFTKTGNQTNREEKCQHCIPNKTLLYRNRHSPETAERTTSISANLPPSASFS